MDALAKLLAETDEGQSDSGEDAIDCSGVTSVSCEMKTLQNGIRRCSVHVKCISGAEYQIEAFDDEAEELYRKASQHSAGTLFVHYQK